MQYTQAYAAIATAKDFEGLDIHQHCLTEESLPDVVINEQVVFEPGSWKLDSFWSLGLNFMPFLTAASCDAYRIQGISTRCSWVNEKPNDWP